MEIKKTHPLVIAAAVSIIIASAVAIASMTGLMPDSEARINDEVKTEADAPEKEKETVSQATPQHKKTSSKRHDLAPVKVAQVCKSCGQISDVREIHKQGEGTGIGAVTGGVAGAVLGKQFGNGNGQTAMTAAGALGGALLGNKIEKDRRGFTEYEVVVGFDDGTSGTYKFQEKPYWQSGDRVKVVNGQIQSAQ